MTMKELAKLAGVSPAAVSRYLNGGSLSAEKQAIIRAAIEKTGYQPDAAAQMLRTRSTDIVGIIAPKLDSESVSRVFAGAAEVLAEEGYACQVSVSQNDPEKELSLLSLLQSRPAAGIILMAVGYYAPLETALRKLSVPAVVLGQRYPNVSCIYHDDFGAMRELTRLVLKRGRRKLAYIGATELDAAVGINRRQGAQAGMAEFGLDPESLCTEISPFDAEGGALAMARLLERKPDLDAVLCATDRMAIGAMHVLKQAGLRVGEDVSVTGVGDSWAGRYMTPNLTTAHLYYKTSGESAARRLVTLMKERGGVQPVYQTMLGYRIQLGDSL